MSSAQLTSAGSLPWPWLEAVVQDRMERDQVPGVAVGILWGGRRHVAGFGVTHLEHPLPVTPETLFQIGSITKTFTGTLALILVEEGVLDLDTPVRSYVPDFRVADPEVSARVTLRHLLTHTAGWFGDHFLDTGAGEDALARYVAEMAGLPQLAPLGEVWSYNNAGFYLAGHLIQQVTGQPFERLLRERVLEPLGMEHAYFDAGQVITHRFAVGHRTGRSGPRVARPWPLPRAANPAGGLCCSVQELLSYAAFHLEGLTSDGTRLLAPETLAAMQAPQVSLWQDRHCGLTWMVEDTGGVRRISHGGATVGQTCLLTLVPNHRLAVAILTNADGGRRLARRVTEEVLERLLGVAVPRPRPMDGAEEALASYVGRYANPFSQIELGLLNDRLVGHVVYRRGFPAQDTPPAPPPPPMTLALCEPHRLLVLDGPFQDDTAEILHRDDGQVGWLRFQGRVHPRIGPKG